MSQLCAPYSSHKVGSGLHFPEELMLREPVVEGFIVREAVCLLIQCHLRGCYRMRPGLRRGHATSRQHTQGPLHCSRSTPHSLVCPLLHSCVASQSCINSDVASTSLSDYSPCQAMLISAGYACFSRYTPRLIAGMISWSLSRHRFAPDSMVVAARGPIPSPQPVPEHHHDHDPAMPRCS